MNAVLSRRFEELLIQAKAVEATKITEADPLNGRPVTRLEMEEFLGWNLRAKNLLERACGPDSLHMKAFQDNEHNSFLTTADIFPRLKAIFLAAKEDFEGGYLVSVKSLVQAEVFTSELEQATELLNKGYATAAAVIAGVVLETTLRDLCARHKLAIGSMDRMNADLSKAGVYNVARQKRVTALAALRNHAAHGKVSEFTSGEVHGMIEDVGRFVADHLEN